MKQQILDLKITTADFEAIAAHLEKAKPHYIPTTEELEKKLEMASGWMPDFLKEKVKSDVFAMQKKDIADRDLIIVLQAKFLQLHQLLQENGLMEAQTAPTPEPETEAAPQA